MALDPGTLELLAAYKEECRKEALAAGGELDEDGFIFSSDGCGKTPWHPDTISKWFHKIADAAGVSTTLHGLRHYNATQMLSSGIDLRTAAGRLGHSGGGAVTLRVYAHRTRPPTSVRRSCSPSNFAALSPAPPKEDVDDDYFARSAP
jgi:integrase